METINETLDRFSKLQPDWDKEGAERISPDAIKSARIVAGLLADDPRPIVSPLANGGVDFYWKISGRYLDWEVLRDGIVEMYREAEGDLSWDITWHLKLVEPTDSEALLESLAWLKGE